jgi:hypothetical protein
MLPGRYVVGTGVSARASADGIPDRRRGGNVLVPAGGVVLGRPSSPAARLVTRAGGLPTKSLSEPGRAGGAVVRIGNPERARAPPGDGGAIGA